MYPLISSGCERDERGRLCGTIVHQSEFEMLVDRAILACDGTDCTNGDCEAAIDEVRDQKCHTISIYNNIMTLCLVRHYRKSGKFRC